MDELEQLRQRVTELETENAELRRELTQVQQQLQQIVRRKRPRQPPGQPKGAASDRRRKQHRQHPGCFRPPPPDEQVSEHHDCTVAACPHCGSSALTPTGHFEDQLVEDLPPPRLEVQRFRRHQFRCQGCQKTSLGQSALVPPGAQVGPRARWLVGYARAHLGISLGKTTALLHDLFGLSLSRAGALGHLKWAGRLCAPVVQKLLELLRQAPVVHADETGWRINGRLVWAWCFANPQIAVFLIDQRRSADVLIQALGESLPGVLVSDFYAAYNRLDSKKQRCLAHLLRELHTLSDKLPAIYVSQHIRPWIHLFQDAIALGKEREQLSPRQFSRRRRDLDERLLAQLGRFSKNADCERIANRIAKYHGELFTFLDEPDVPSDNNLAERDIRSVVAARSDGGVNRSAWGATAFGHIKSVLRTCQKNGRSFFDYGLELVQAHLAGREPPLPLVVGTG